MPARQSLIKSFVAAIVIAVACLTVGFTAEADSPFSISIHTAFLQLGIDLDVKLGSLHLHASWSALPAIDRLANQTTGGSF